MLTEFGIHYKLESCDVFQQQGYFGNALAGLWAYDFDKMI